MKQFLRMFEKTMALHKNQPTKHQFPDPFFFFFLPSFERKTFIALFTPKNFNFTKNLGIKLTHTVMLRRKSVFGVFYMFSLP